MIYQVQKSTITKQDGDAKSSKGTKANVELIHLASQLKSHQARLVLSFAKSLFGSELNPEGSPFE